MKERNCLLIKYMIYQIYKYVKKKRERETEKIPYIKWQ